MIPFAAALISGAHSLNNFQTIGNEATPAPKNFKKSRLIIW
jgi:hypothetical protein